MDLKRYLELSYLVKNGDEGMRQLKENFIEACEYLGYKNEDENNNAFNRWCECIEELADETLGKDLLMLIDNVIVNTDWNEEAKQHLGLNN